MRSPNKGRPPRMTLADLAPQKRIDCMLCGQKRPASGARPFRAYMVCAECAAKIGNNERKS